MSENHKKIPSTIAIVGASSRTGAPLAHWLRFHVPNIKLRLISSKPAVADQLRADFRDCEVAVASFYDLPSLTEAVKGVEGLYISTTTGTREEEAMTNLVSALRVSGTLIHMIRVVGVFPDVNIRRLPKNLVDYGLGLEVQHQIAKRVLNESDLPVTYFNIGASFVDNLLRQTRMAPNGVLTWPDRKVPYVDPREVGEAAGRILTSDNHRHLHQFYTLNNGYDHLYLRDVVSILSDVLLHEVKYDPTPEGFRAATAPLVQGGLMPESLPEYLINFFAYEDDNDLGWVLNDFLERTLERRPNTVRAWIQEHREILRHNLKIRM